MERGLLRTHGKKLFFVGLVVVGAILLVGEEDDPGVLAATQREASAAGNGAGEATGFSPPQAAYQPSLSQAPPSQPMAPAPSAPVAPPAEILPATGDALIDPATGTDPAPMFDPTPAT